MTERERYLATLLFRNPDRVPFQPGGGRKSTREAWRRQGLPAEVTDIGGYVRSLLGLPADTPGFARVSPGVDFRMRPQFEEKVLERRARSLIVQDWKGNVCEISDRYDVSYLREPIDFVTRRWLRCPVRTRDDWEQMKTRYRLDDAGRFPADFAARARRLTDRARVSSLSISGPFWQLREWLGAEALYELFVEDPGWLAEMVSFWQAFVAGMLERIFEHYAPDHLTINEDMAFKERAFVSPAMVRAFLFPCWRRWTSLARQAGVPVLDVDSDGYVGELIPIWIEAGFNCNSPQEVAAGNDLPAYRRQYGTQMAYHGGVDKRALAAGGDTLRRELERLKPVVKSGGYIPSCDHGIPPDVSWQNYLEYCRELARLTGWL
jgi:uroporphyrinogen decarboxylase